MSTKYLLNVFQGDQDYGLGIQLLDSTGNPIDLTGASTVTLFAQLIDTINQIVTFSGSCSVVAPLTGNIIYNINPGDLNIAGIYDAVVEVVYTGGQIVRFGDIAISCKPRLPIS